MAEGADKRVAYYGAYGLCRDPQGRLLLVHIAGGLDAGHWALPGGGIEWGEHPDDAVRREMEEETGIVDIRGMQVTAVFSTVYERSAARPFDPVQHVGIVYEIALGAYDLRDEKDGTTDRCAWFTEQEARGLPLTRLGAFGVGQAWPG